jgi:hypothetical protein
VRDSCENGGGAAGARKRKKREARAEEEGRGTKVPNLQPVRG